jgi:GcrA cell cycle regulator
VHTSEFQNQIQFRFSEIVLDIYFGITEITQYREASERSEMQSNWVDQHSEALREYFAKGMSYSKIAEAINSRFGTAYSRNAALGRAQRMGLGGSERPDDRQKPSPKAAPWPHELRERRASEFIWPMPTFKCAKKARLRRVEVDPRHLCLLQLERGDCRYPYGGDEEGEAITFCGHPRRKGSSYCTPHFHLTCGPGTVPERAASSISLRLVEAA